MNIEPTSTTLSTSIWQALQTLSHSTGQPLSWLDQLMCINTTLVETLQIDGLWLMTLGHVPHMASGVIHTPLSGNAAARVELVDETPPMIEEFAPGHPLYQVIHQQEPHFFQPDDPVIDFDLGSTLFFVYDTDPTVMLPLIDNHKTVGILVIAGLQFATPEARAVINFFSTFLGLTLGNLQRAHQANQSIQDLTEINADLHRKLQQQVQNQTLVNKVTLAIDAGHGLSEVARLIVAQFSQQFTFQHLSLALLDDGGRNVRQWIFSEHGCREEHDLYTSLHKSALADVIPPLQPRIYSDLLALSEAEKEQPENQLLLQEGIRSKIAIPFKTTKGLQGAFNLGHEMADLYTTYDLNLLKMLIPHIAIRIEQARLVDATEQGAATLKKLNQLGEMLASVTEASRMIEIVLSMLPRLLPSDVQAIAITDEDGVHLSAAIPYNFRRIKKTIEEIYQTFVEAADNHPPLPLLSTNHVSGNLPVHNDWQPETVLALPILTRQGVSGLLYVAHGTEEFYSNEFFRTAALVVSQISSSVESANLFRQVKYEHARLAAILASSTDAILVVRKNRRIVLDNPAAWAVMGVSHSQRGKLLTEATVNQALIELFERAMAGRETNGEIPLLQPSSTASEQTMFANLSPVSINSDDIIGWVATMQNVSHFKLLNELKNEFVNTVSHDLRSPLSSILIAVKLMEQTGPVNETQHGLLDTVDRKVKAIHNLVDNLLDVGKIEAGIDIQLEMQSVLPILADAYILLQTQAEAKSIELNQEIAPNLPSVRANKIRLQQVFQNLIGNAIKYTPENGQVTVRAYVQDDELRIQVTDTGSGIPTADQPRIFEKFYRVRGEHVKSIKGTGLGLAITKGIVEKHEGQIWLDSVFGEGSTFTVALPIIIDNE